ncbi:SCO2521 family protein [Actinocorallia lasiicapitis]
MRTGFARHSRQLSRELASALLDLVPGEQVRHANRPRPYAVSPEPLTGVDCSIPSKNGRRVRGVGTVAARATLTGGRVLQACAYTSLVPSAKGYRLPWSHYLGHPGTVEVLGKMNADDTAAGYAEDERGFLGIQLGVIAEHTMNNVQSSPLLDGGLPVKASRGSWRWAFQCPEPGGREIFRFKILTDGTRLLRLSIPGQNIPDMLDLIEDMALHDWLLGTVEGILERAELGNGSTSRMVDRVRPVIDHVLHHWMPGARITPELLPLWNALDRVQGLTRQWEISVNRVRDQLALGTISMLSAAAGK